MAAALNPQAVQIGLLDFADGDFEGAFAIAVVELQGLADDSAWLIFFGI